MDADKFTHQIAVQHERVAALHRRISEAPVSQREQLDMIELFQTALEELDVAERARRLIEMLREHAPAAAPAADPDRKFPPEFSAN